MSGIAGIIHFDGAPVEPGQVEKMTSNMAHRGPDGIHHWVKGSVALGQCMLHTTPESLEETQPLTNEDESLVLVMDGRVDNWEELRKELLVHPVALRSHSDAELVLRAYEIWGRDCLQHIEGDFALVIWDSHRKKAFCARDRVGNKPFHYFWNGRTLTFASELQAILALPSIKPTVNEGMLAEYLAAEIYSRDETLWRGIMRLVAAHHMQVDHHGLKVEKYWLPDATTKLLYKEEKEYVDHYRELFANVVRRMSRSQLLLGCEVSGGLDSSAIFAMAQQLRSQQQLLAPAIEGFTLDFHDDPAANELEYAHAVGKHWGVRIHEVAPANMPLSWYQQWMGHYQDFPVYPNGVMGLSIREEVKSLGGRVLMVGVGGDEWLWGNRSHYAEMLSTAQWRQLYDILKADCREAGARSAIWWILRAGLAPLLPEVLRNSLRKIIDVRNGEGSNKYQWLAPPMLAALQVRRKAHRDQLDIEAISPGQRNNLFMLNSAFNVFARESEERLASSVGTELRRPFWSAELVQFAFSCPTQLRLRGNVDRALHRKAMHGLLPKQVLQRHTKADFMVTYRQVLAPAIADLMGRVAGERVDWVKPAQIAELSHRIGQVRYGGWPEWMLWTLFCCDRLASVNNSACAPIDHGQEMLAH